MQEQMTSQGLTFRNDSERKLLVVLRFQQLHDTIAALKTRNHKNLAIRMPASVLTAEIDW